MKRVIVCANHCSPVEQCLLKGLRAIGWTEPEKAMELLTRIGIEPARLVVFEALVAALLARAPVFDLLGPGSPYISPDELDLLAALAQISRKSSDGHLPPQHRLPKVLHPLIERCGHTLAECAVHLKSRPLFNRRPTLVKSPS
ncbi:MULTISPECIES: hypothetical protein [unclassified Pseudomonas]|uniref:hypothetical protein n=1 Tax=unclassified Pseudomonas TaxID=196821 RepID=UPI0015A3F423|nr:MULTISPECIES: hypothetical protein [unclassified Pseudomonas]NWC92837.1 hypothetical protein [Pseudomonas sp. IPO3779]NWD17551.1 hypothetical protein [Pseudomonas sp. IPO3778]